MSLFFRASTILTAIGIEEKLAVNALRLSLGRSTTKQDIDDTIADLVQAVEKLVNETDRDEHLNDDS